MGLGWSSAFIQLNRKFPSFRRELRQPILTTTNSLNAFLRNRDQDAANYDKQRHVLLILCKACRAVTPSVVSIEGSAWHFLLFGCRRDDLARKWKEKLDENEQVS